MAARLVCWRPLTGLHFGLVLARCQLGADHVPFGILNALRDKMGSHVAAIMAGKTVQGEGALGRYRMGICQVRAAAADEFGALVIADEVQADWSDRLSVFL